MGLTFLELDDLKVISEIDVAILVNLPRDPRSETQLTILIAISIGFQSLEDLEGFYCP